MNSRPAQAATPSRILQPILPRPPVPGNTPPPANANRPVRSRKNRPCDRCRRSKLRCDIGPEGPPCVLCRESTSGKQCTFDYAPPVRPPRKVRENVSVDLELEREREAEVSFSEGEGYEWDNSGNGAAGDESDDPRVGSGRSDGPSEPRGQKRPRESDTPRPGQAIHRSHYRSPRVHPGAAVRGQPTGKAPASVHSFDRLASSRYDPHVLTVVLTDDLLPIANPNDERPSGEPHVKQISMDPARPIFVIMDPKPDTSQLPVPGAVGLGLIRTFLRHHPVKISETRLVSLYYEHIHPALPILPEGSADQLPPALYSMVLTSAMNHGRETRDIAAPTFALLDVGRTPLEMNNLAGVASAVLELGIRPINSNRSSYLLLAKTVALAQLLGMHINPLGWAIPPWEQGLRIRLWWTLAIHDAWMSFLNSRPALVQAGNNSIPLPSLSSLLEASCAHGSASSDSAKAFLASCRLALLVRQLQANVCTLDVVAQKSSKERREEVMAIARKADHLWAEWKSSRARPTGVTSFLIHLLGLRCMLRRIHLELEHGIGSTFTLGPEVLVPFRECVDLVASLQEDECDGYYLNYASHILSSVTSSLTRFTLSSSTNPHTEAMDLLSQLLRALRRLHTEYGWDIAGPALRRAAAVQARLESMGEHEVVVRALHGGEDTQAAVPPPITPVPPATVTEPQMTWDWSGLDWNIDDLFGMP